MFAPAFKRSKADRMKKPRAMREESLLVYWVGRRVLRHLCQYLICLGMSSFGSLGSATMVATAM